MHTPKFYSSIRFQIIMSVVITSLIMMVLSFLWASYHYRNQMNKNFQQYKIHLSDALESALEMCMRTENTDDMKSVVQALAGRDDIEKASIFTKNGKVFISSAQNEIPMSSEACQICHEYRMEKWTKAAKNKEIVKHDLPNGNQVMRSINLIENKPSCYNAEGCHPKETGLLGMLMLDYSMQSFRSEVSRNVKQLMLVFAAVGIAVFFLLYFLMNKVIFNKLAHIVEITGLVGKGDITQRIEAMGDNEISQLAASFNTVIQTLEESTKENEEQKNYLTHLINSIEDEIVVVDRRHRITMINNAAIADRNITREEAVGMLCHQIAHLGTGRGCPNTRCPATMTFATGKLYKVTHLHDDEEGGTKYMEIYSSPLLGEDGEVIQVIEVMRDITERQLLRTQLIHSEKLSLVGRIAAGMAHEINNPIASIAMCAESLKKQARDLESEGGESIRNLSKYLAIIEESAYRCKDITDKMLILSRQVESTFELVNPNDVIENTLDLAKHEAEEEQKNINLDLAEDMTCIQADRSQLNQVFLNLLLNGLDAIDASGEMTITTRKASDFVEIIFEDKGCGIAEENLQKIFEPFFTTKPIGKGTGLGLSISAGIIQEHGGTIGVSSELGIGTTFSVVLPTNVRRSVDRTEVSEIYKASSGSLLKPG